MKRDTAIEHKDAWKCKILDPQCEAQNNKGLELEEHILYMPERYTSLQDDIISEMDDGKFNIHKSNENLYLEISQ